MEIKKQKVLSIFCKCVEEHPTELTDDIIIANTYNLDDKDLSSLASAINTEFATSITCSDLSKAKRINDIVALIQ